MEIVLADSINKIIHSTNVLSLEEGEILQKDGRRVCYMFRGNQRERVRVPCVSYANAQKVFDSVEVLV